MNEHLACPSIPTSLKLYNMWPRDGHRCSELPCVVHLLDGRPSTCTSNSKRASALPCA